VLEVASENPVYHCCNAHRAHGTLPPRAGVRFGGALWLERVGAGLVVRPRDFRILPRNVTLPPPLHNTRCSMEVSLISNWSYCAKPQAKWWFGDGRVCESEWRGAEREREKERERTPAKASEHHRVSFAFVFVSRFPARLATAVASFMSLQFLIIWGHLDKTRPSSSRA